MYPSRTCSRRVTETIRIYFTGGGRERSIFYHYFRVFFGDTSHLTHTQEECMLLVFFKFYYYYAYSILCARAYFYICMSGIQTIYENKKRQNTCFYSNMQHTLCFFSSPSSPYGYHVIILISFIYPVFSPYARARRGGRPAPLPAQLLLLQQQKRAAAAAVYQQITISWSQAAAAAAMNRPFLLNNTSQQYAMSLSKRTNIQVYIIFQPVCARFSLGASYA